MESGMSAIGVIILLIAFIMVFVMAKLLSTFGDTCGMTPESGNQRKEPNYGWEYNPAYDPNYTRLGTKYNKVRNR